MSQALQTDFPNPKDQEIHHQIGIFKKDFLSSVISSPVDLPCWCFSFPINSIILNKKTLIVVFSLVCCMFLVKLIHSIISPVHLIWIAYHAEEMGSESFCATSYTCFHQTTSGKIVQQTTYWDEQKINANV